MKFDMPKGAVVLANFIGRDAKGKKTKREWRKHLVLDVTEKGHSIWIDFGHGTEDFTKIAFASARVDSLVLHHDGRLVMGRFKLSEAAQTVYSARPLWWSSPKTDQERAATVLEVWMYEQGFVPYPNWRLVDIENGDVPSFFGPEQVWRAPIRLTRSNSEAKEEYFDEKRLAEIQQYEKLYTDAKTAAKEASALATKYRLKLAVLKRMR
jgi:hypothetical protein